MKRAVAKLFTIGGSQAVRIPKRFRLVCSEVLIERDGDRIILTPWPLSWKEYFATAAQLPSDYPDAMPDVCPEKTKAL